MDHPTTTPPRAGWRIRDWCRAIGIARSTYYTLRGERAPASTKIGTMHIVTESPDAWLRRIGGAAQKEAAFRAALSEPSE